MLLPQLATLITRANYCKSSSVAVWPEWQTLATGGNMPVCWHFCPLGARVGEKNPASPAFALLRVTGEEERDLQQKINIFVLFRMVSSSRYVVVHLCLTDLPVLRLTPPDSDRAPAGAVSAGSCFVTAWAVPQPIHFHFCLPVKLYS